LPRAIKFTAPLYSIGLPPEVLGLDALDDADIGFLRDTYINFDEDLRAAARFLNTETGFVPRELAERVADLVDVEPDAEHAEITGEIARALRENETGRLSSLILSAAHRRRFLG
ncbi:MAG: phosphoenolpyruvate carboxylase, partial [Methanomicrobiales archaeon]|nr:phosphoenolpyruvate carboxylase [Methanomicrobiales archaeon]